jgi:Recombinase
VLLVLRTTYAPRGKGNSFGVGQVHKLLTNTIYIGRWKFNQASSKTGERKPDNEVVEIPVPAIIEPDTFERVQRQLLARSPKRQAPRVTTGPILLTGLAVCATCGGGMTLRTGMPGEFSLDLPGIWGPETFRVRAGSRPTCNFGSAGFARIEVWARMKSMCRKITAVRHPRA